MERALVTGASGFVGRALAEYLVTQGDTVRCVFRPSSQISPFVGGPYDTRVFHFDDEATWDAAFRDIDVIYHVAGQTRAINRAELWKSNVQLTARIASIAARQAKPPVLVLVSSIAAAGPQAVPEPPPRLIPHPISDYGWSKWQGELAACQWSHALPVTIVRPGIVCGPRNLELWPLFQMVARTGCYLAPGTRAHRLAFIDVRDLARLLRQVAQSGQRVNNQQHPSYGCYDACLAEHPSHAELALLLAKAVGRQLALTVPIPRPLLWSLAVAGDTLAQWRRQPFALTLDKVREATAGSWVGDAKRVIREFHFQPEFGLETGLRDTATWYRLQGWI